MITDCLYCVERNVGCLPFVCPKCETEWCHKNGTRSICPDCGYDFNNPKEENEDDY